jgi:outer membrane protein assembly factor BamB
MNRTTIVNQQTRKGTQQQKEPATMQFTHLPMFARNHFVCSVLLMGVLFAGNLYAAEAAPATPTAGVIAACTVTVPTGDYALVTLDFSVKGAPKGYETWTYMGGIRGSRMSMYEGIGLREPSGLLELKDGKLSGTFLRNNSRSVSSTSLDPVPPVQVSVEAVVKDGLISGTAEIAGVKGTVSGRMVIEAELAKGNAVAKDKSWPAAQGPQAGGCSAQWTGVATINDLSSLRMQWRCEEGDIGQGPGSITRFMSGWKDASSRRTGSGAAAPIAADGRIFLSYFVPAVRDSKTPEVKGGIYGGTETELAAAMLAEAKTAGYTGSELPGYAREKIFQSADDVVLCMDAATGKTLWKAVIKNRGINMQHHKAGPFDMTPAYGKGRVFALGMSGWLYAFEAETGKPLWEVKSEFDHSNALLVVGDVLIAPAAKQWGAYEVATGKLLWKAGGGRSMSTLSAWSSGGQDYLIGIMGPGHARTGVGCIEVASGKVLWTLPINVVTGGRGQGPGGITISGDRMLVYQDNGTGKKDAEMKPALAAYQLTPNQPPQPLWLVTDSETGKAEKNDSNHMGCIHGESVPVVVRGKFVFTPDLRVLDLATGKVLGQAKGPRPSNGGYMQVIEDLVLVREDGTHGGISCGFYKIGADGSVVAFSDKPWHPPFGGGTTSYHHPIFYPLVDGRIFLRQQDGIYCWDVRQAIK